MPKKHQNRALLTKPASSAPSNLSSNRTIASSSNGQSSKPSVNDLIRESRRTKGDVKQSIDNTNISSLPPSVRAILNMPVPNAPPPRTQIRGPGRLRRIPGPPPPQSWLEDSMHAPESTRSTFARLRWLRARLQQQAATLPGCDHFPRQDSLEHLCLKKMATNWQWHAEYDNTYLSTLPVLARELLLSYIAIYNDSLWSNPFPFLFPRDCDQDELENVTRLDLANHLGTWATVRKIEKELISTTAETSKTAPLSERFVASLKSLDSIPESWDAEEEISPAHPQSSHRLQSHLRFANLKHLSLAVSLASSAAPPSWSHLISLTSNLSRLTSLSLAHWPNPTYTPNAAKGRVKMIDSTRPTLPTQTYGGSDYYTSLDSNWREAAGILRSLSRNLYCLTWLDLTGCAPWLPALTWTDEEGNESGADFNGSWRGLSKLILAVGWLPGKPTSLLEDDLSSTTRSTSSINSTRAIEQLYGGQQAIQEALEAIAQLRMTNRAPRQPPEGHDDAANVPWNVEHEREKQYFRKDVERYVNQRDTARQVAQEIRRRRKAGNSPWLDFEFGELIDEKALGIEQQYSF